MKATKTRTDIIITITMSEKEAESLRRVLGGIMGDVGRDTYELFNAIDNALDES